MRAHPLYAIGATIYQHTSNMMDHKPSRTSIPNTPYGNEPHKPLFHHPAPHREIKTPPVESKTPPGSHPSATFGLGILGA